MLVARLKKRPQLTATVTKPYQGKGYAEGYEAGKSAGYEAAEAEIFFTNHGTMYKKHHVISTDYHDGFYNYAYRYADRMETLSVPNMRSVYTAQTSVFEGCSALKTASLPKIERIGANYFSGCTALEEVTLGCDDRPMATFASSSFNGCAALVRFRYIGTIPTSVSFAQSPLLDDESIRGIVDALADLTGQAAQTLTLHATVGAKLTEAQKATITAKNWTLVY